MIISGWLFFRREDMPVILNSTSSFKSQVLGFMQRNPGLKKLDLTDNQLGVANQQEVCEMLAALKETEVEHLVLAGAGLGYKSGDELREMAGSLRDSKVSTVDLQNNFFGHQKTVSDLEKLLAGFKETPVHSLDMSENHLDIIQSDELESVFDASGLDITYESPRHRASP